MNYQHTEDIDESREFSVTSLDPLDPQIKIVINRTANAIESLSIGGDSLNGRILADIYRGFLTSHKAIHLLISKKEEDTVIAIEAMSLAREQVESLFTVCLLLDNPLHWFMVYKKDSWSLAYRRYLLTKHECEKLPSWKEYINKTAPNYLAKLEKLYGITCEEKEAIEFKFNNPNEKLPPHLKNKLPEPFPTAGRAKGHIKNTSLKDCLERWYQEYQYLSGYSHGHMVKPLGLSILESRELNISEEEKQKYYENELEPSLTVSYVSSASVCAESCPLLDYNIEVIEALTNLWNELTELSLLGKLFWNIRIRNLLGAIQT